MGQSKINRRGFLGTMGTAATALATQSRLRPRKRMPHRQLLDQIRMYWLAVPRTGERVTALGLGTFLTFDVKPGVAATLFKRTDRFAHRRL